MFEYRILNQTACNAAENARMVFVRYVIACAEANKPINNWIIPYFVVRAKNARTFCPSVKLLICEYVIVIRCE